MHVHAGLVLHLLGLAKLSIEQGIVLAEQRPYAVRFVPNNEHRTGSVTVERLNHGRAQAGATCCSLRDQ
jgi:hypothetical protein